MILHHQSNVTINYDDAIVACSRTSFEKAVGGILHLDCKGVAFCVSNLTKYLLSTNNSILNNQMVTQKITG